MPRLARRNAVRQKKGGDLILHLILRDKPSRQEKRDQALRNKAARNDNKPKNYNVEDPLGSSGRQAIEFWNSAQCSIGDVADVGSLCTSFDDERETLGGSGDDVPVLNLFAGSF